MITCRFCVLFVIIENISHFINSSVTEISSVSSASVCKHEWLLMAIMAINGYYQKLNFFVKEFFYLFIIYLLFIYQSMIKYNNVNIY